MACECTRSNKDKKLALYPELFVNLFKPASNLISSPWGIQSRKKFEVVIIWEKCLLLLSSLSMMIGLFLRISVWVRKCSPLTLYQNFCSSLSKSHARLRVSWSIQSVGDRHHCRWIVSSFFQGTSDRHWLVSVLFPKVSNTYKNPEESTIFCWYMIWPFRKGQW